MTDNIDAWSPEIKKQLIGLSKKADNTVKDGEDKVSDSGRGSTTVTDEEMELSQNEPLDLSMQHRSESPVDKLSPSESKLFFYIR